MSDNLKVLNNKNPKVPGYGINITDGLGLGNKSYIDKDKKQEKRFDTFNCLNIGVPVTAPVEYCIYFSELGELSEDKQTLSLIILENVKSIFSSINKEFGIKYSFLIPSFGFAFSFSTDDDLKTRLVISSKLALHNIYDALLSKKLEVFYEKTDYENISYELNKGIENLRNVKTEKELRKKFPIIYEEYTDFKEKFKEVLAIESCEILPMKLAAIQNMDKGFGSYSEYYEYFKGGFSLEKYIDSASSMYSIYANNLKSYLEFLDKMPIYFTKGCKIDEDKLALFTAYHYLINGILNYNDKQKYLYYVASYLKECEVNKKNTTLEVFDYFGKNKGNHINRITINYKYIEKEFRNMLVESPELNFIDFSRDYFNGMTPEEINSYMDDYLTDIRLNWDFLLPNDETINKETTDLINKASKETKVRDEEEFKEHLMNLYMDKKSFFDSSNPFCMLKGKSTFSGYVGYCYSNGKVILDKYYENEKTKRLAFGEAIYVMDLPSFYLLSKMSKAEIINGKLCRRIYHRGTWKDRAQEEIESGNPIAKSELGVLIKKMNVKKDMK